MVDSSLGGQHGGGYAPTHPSRSGLVTWLRYKYQVPSGDSYFSRAMQGLDFNPNGFLDQPGAWQALPALSNKLSRPNCALMPLDWASDEEPSLANFNSGVVQFFTKFLDRVLAVIDDELVSVASNSGDNPQVALTGLAFFSSRFRWSSNNNEKDCNVCKPFSKRRVKRAKYFSLTRGGYLQATLGAGPDPKTPCVEYVHRLVCFMFNGPPPPGKDQVSHRCHNKECLNPSHLVWASSKENHNQEERKPHEI